MATRLRGPSLAWCSRSVARRRRRWGIVAIATLAVTGRGSLVVPHVRDPVAVRLHALRVGEVVATLQRILSEAGVVCANRRTDDCARCRADRGTASTANSRAEPCAECRADNGACDRLIVRALRAARNSASREVL